MDNKFGKKDIALPTIYIKVLQARSMQYLLMLYNSYVRKNASIKSAFSKKTEWIFMANG